MKFRLTVAGLLFAFTQQSCVTQDAMTGEKEVSGSTIGAVTGAVAGAVLGNQVKGDKATREKARVAGALAGAAIGGAIGWNADKAEAKLRAKLQAAGVSVTKQGDQLILNMPGNVTFDSGMASIKPSFQEVLDAVGSVLLEMTDASARVAGHTDNKGNSQANQTLSVQRAEAVANYLRDSVKGKDPGRITSVGYGQSQPIADNKTEEGRASNRRVEITMSKKK